MHLFFQFAGSAPGLRGEEFCAALQANARHAAVAGVDLGDVGPQARAARIHVARHPDARPHRLTTLAIALSHIILNFNNDSLHFATRLTSRLRATLLMLTPLAMYGCLLCSIPGMCQHVGRRASGAFAAFGTAVSFGPDCAKGADGDVGGGRNGAPGG